VRFEGIAFSYKAARGASLKVASFNIPVGAVTALVGGSGAGKTTIVNLLFQLYQPDCGLITVDGVLLSYLSGSDWLITKWFAGRAHATGFSGLMRHAVLNWIRLRNRNTATPITGWVKTPIKDSYLVGLDRSLTPGPPPFSSMNSTPAIAAVYDPGDTVTLWLARVHTRRLLGRRDKKMSVFVTKYPLSSVAGITYLDADPATNDGVSWVGPTNVRSLHSQLFRR